MPRYEYRVVPAPSKGVRAKGVKGPAARFSFALQDLMNKMGATGWEYQRAETLPSVERAGLTSTTTEWRNVLVFRREAEAEANAETPVLLPAPELESEPEDDDADTEQEQVAAKKATSENLDNADGDTDAMSDALEEKGPGAIRMLRDNGVEDVSDVSGVTNSLKQLVASRKSGKSET